MSDEDEIMIFGEVFQQQTQFAQAFDGHVVGIINDGREHFTAPIQPVCFVDEQTLALVIVAVVVDLESFTEDAQDAM